VRSLGAADEVCMVDQSKKEKKGTAMDEEGSVPSLEKHQEGMKLQGEEKEDLDFSGEFEELVREVRWLALFRVHIRRSHLAMRRCSVR
jgi:hypothetical protein